MAGRAKCLPIIIQSKLTHVGVRFEGVPGKKRCPVVEVRSGGSQMGVVGSGAGGGGCESFQPFVVNAIVV